jgi:hypothetical protein
MTDIRLRLAEHASRIFASLTLRLVLIALVAALAFNTYGVFSFKGPLGIGLSFEGWKPRAERLARDLDNVKAAQAIALERAEAARARTEAKYLKLAGRIDNEAHNARVDALADAERWIAGHRVRCEAIGGAAGSTLTAAADRGSGGGQSLPGAGELDTAVAVSADDVRACTLNTIQANAARDWALGLEAASGR